MRLGLAVFESVSLLPSVNGLTGTRQGPRTLKAVLGSADSRIPWPYKRQCVSTIILLTMSVANPFKPSIIYSIQNIFGAYSTWWSSAYPPPSCSPPPSGYTPSYYSILLSFMPSAKPSRPRVRFWKLRLTGKLWIYCYGWALNRLQFGYSSGFVRKVNAYTIIEFWMPIGWTWTRGWQGKEDTWHVFGSSSQLPQRQNYHVAPVKPNYSIRMYILAFVMDTLPRSIYSFLLLNTPNFYYSRFTRTFSEAGSIREIQSGIRKTIRHGKSKCPHKESPKSPRFEKFEGSWNNFIVSVVKDWEMNNLIAVLLLS